MLIVHNADECLRYNLGHRKENIFVFNCRKVIKVTPQFFSIKYLYLIDGRKGCNCFLGKLEVNPSSATGLFLCSLKALENLWLYDIFRWYRKKAMV